MEKNISNNINLDNNLIEKKQNTFIETSLWKVINAGLNTGIRAILPNFIEDQIIEIKDAILNNGFKAGAKQAIASAIDMGKTASGIVTGKFESISQAQNAIKSGGLIDTMSIVFNKAVNSAVNKKIINENVGNIIKKGKNIVLNTVESNIENSLNRQILSIEKIDEHIDGWRKYYEEKNFENMEKEYKKIKQNLKEVLPIENIINQARKLENLHLLIKNNGHNFEISKEEYELAKMLVS